MTPTFDQSLLWVQEWMAEKRPELTHTTTSGGTHWWGNEFAEYCFYEGGFGELCFSKTGIEITEYQIFQFVIPATKEQLFTVLNILDV